MTCPACRATACRATACPCPQVCHLPDAPQPTTAQRIATSLLAHALFTALSLARLVLVVIHAPGP